MTPSARPIPPVNLANVNIPLQQFKDISSGKIRSLDRGKDGKVPESRRSFDRINAWPHARGNIALDAPMAKKAKISGSVVAGFPSPAEQYQEQPLDLNELLVKRPAASFFVRVQGDSMVGAGIQDGDLLVVDRSLRPASGDIIIACVDGDFTVKRYREGGQETGKGERGTGTVGTHKIWLEPANPKYSSIVLEPGQELDYFGKVTACIHRF